MVIKKISKLMGELTMREIQKDVAKNMIVENHYSHKWQGYFGRVNVGIFRDDKLLGVAVYGSMMNSNSYGGWSDAITKDEIVELNRMWISDELGHNAETILISASIKIIRADHPEIRIIQTFADGRLGCGTIYKAASFRYYGYTESLFFRNTQTLEVFHKVPIENTKDYRNFTRLNQMFLDGLLVPFKVRTYRYGYILDKKLLNKIKFTEQPYPEYHKGEFELPDYVHPSGILERVYLFFEHLKNEEYMWKASDYYYKKYNRSILENLDIQRQNESLIEFKNTSDIIDGQMSLFEV